MKARNLTVMAVVGVGAVALAAPAAFASAPDVSGVSGGLGKLEAVGKSAKKQARVARKSSFQKRTDEDIKRLGNNVHELRVQDQQITSTISSLVGTITPILTQLGAAATSYANFEYGVVQLGKCSNAACDTFTPFAGSFVATPRIDPTVEQATVSASFAPPATAATGIVGASVAVRSANPTANDAKSKVYCRVTTSQNGNGAAQTMYATSLPNSAFNNAPAYEVGRSPIAPTDAAELQTFPLSMVSTDTQVKLITSTKAGGFGGAAPVAGGFTAVGSDAGGAALNVTLSCLSVPNQA